MELLQFPADIHNLTPSSWRVKVISCEITNHTFFSDTSVEMNETLKRPAADHDLRTF